MVARAVGKQQTETGVTLGGVCVSQWLRWPSKVLIWALLKH